MKLILVVSVVLASVIAADSDHCNSFHNCAACVASPFCGWCSSKVVYQDGAPGHHCAGFNKNSSDPFVCNGIYSTKTCQRGYECDKVNYTCALGAPGTGVSKATCEANCSDVGKTFVCDNATHTCKVAGPGEGTSLPICEQECLPSHSNHPQSHHPASNSPASAHPASPGPHASPSPTPTVAPTYSCNTSTLQCEKAEPGHGASLSACEAGCKKSNHTPAALTGLWRAVPISFKTKLQEVDIEFDKESFQWATREETVSGTVSTVADKSVTLSTSSWTLQCIWESEPGLPETFELILACGTELPTSISSAMKSDSVYFMSRCVPDGVCKFHLGPHNQTRGEEGELESVFQRVATVEDPCEKYAANCTDCLSHQYCGWCSTNVIYNDGKVGKQCAGFNNKGGKNAFTCTGSYSTEMCLPGYVCDAVNQTCQSTTPGSGMPKSACDASCKAKKGPPTQLDGRWRGLVINNGYKFGAIEVDMSSGNESTINITGTAVGGEISGTLKHIAGQLFITYANGPHAGSSVAGIYTIQQVAEVTYIDAAFGGANEDAPTNYKTAMKSPDMQFVLVKCTVSGCPW